MRDLFEFQTVAVFEERYLATLISPFIIITIATVTKNKKWRRGASGWGVDNEKLRSKPLNSKIFPTSCNTESRRRRHLVLALNLFLYRNCSRNKLIDSTAVKSTLVWF